MFERIKRMFKSVETPKDVQKWQKRLEDARNQYEKELKNMFAKDFL